MKVCPNCKQVFPDDHSFCGNCGSRLIIKTMYCGKCGTQIKSGQKFCGSCGAPISSDIISTMKETAGQIKTKLDDSAKKILSDENINKVKNTASAVRDLADENISKVSAQVKETCSAENATKLKHSILNIYADFKEVVSAIRESRFSSEIALKLVKLCMVISVLLTFLTVPIDSPRNISALLILALLKRFIGIVYALNVNTAIALVIWYKRSIFQVIQKSHLDNSLDEKGQNILIAMCVGFSLIPIALTGGIGLIIVGVTLFWRWKNIWTAIHYPGVGTAFIKVFVVIGKALLIIIITVLIYIPIYAIHELIDENIARVIMPMVILGMIFLEIILFKYQNFSSKEGEYDYSKQYKCIKFVGLFCLTLGISGLIKWALNKDINVDLDSTIIADNTATPDYAVDFQPDTVTDNSVSTHRSMNVPPINPIDLSTSGNLENVGTIITPESPLPTNSNATPYPYSYSAIINSVGQNSDVGTTDFLPPNSSEVLGRNDFNPAPKTENVVNCGVGVNISSMDPLEQSSSNSSSHFSTDGQHIYVDSSHDGHKPIDMVDANPSGVNTIRSESGSSGSYEHGGIIRNQKTGAIITDEAVTAKYDIVHKSSKV